MLNLNSYSSVEKDPIFKKVDTTMHLVKARVSAILSVSENLEADKAKIISALELTVSACNEVISGMDTSLEEINAERFRVSVANADMSQYQANLF